MTVGARLSNSAAARMNARCDTRGPCDAHVRRWPPHLAGDAKLPLGELLSQLLEWLPRQSGLKWPSYATPAPPTFSVSAQVQELGLFARRPIGIAVADSLCARRVFTRANLEVLQPTMRALGVQLKEHELPLEVSKQPMEALLATVPSFTEEERVVNETRANFGYNLDRHRRVQTHIIARSVVSRMQGDMAAYSYKEQNSTKLRLRNINAEFERLLGALWSDVCCPWDLRPPTFNAIGSNRCFTRVHESHRLARTIARTGSPSAREPSTRLSRRARR